MVVGAPTIAALTARVPRKQLVLGLLALFAVGTVASALAPTFELVLVARFVAALPHGAYFGAAGLLAAAIMGPGNQAKGFAVVLGGLTAANVFGVPAITRLGQAAGWRTAYLAIAVIFAADACRGPRHRADRRRSRRRLTARRARRLPRAPGVARRGGRGPRLRRLLRHRQLHRPGHHPCRGPVHRRRCPGSSSPSASA